jgi:hypothetical protein
MRVILGLAAALCAATLAGCNTTAPIENVSDAAVISPVGKSLSAEQVRGAIVRAGAGLGWVMKDAGPGKLSGTLLLRTHTAEVEIPYSPSQYSITYKSSVNLQEGAGKIHRNYNGWIQNLNRGINAQLSAS